MVACAIVTPSSLIPVHVINFTDQSTTLHKGTRIAYLTEVEEVEGSSVLVSSIQRKENVSLFHLNWR